MSTFKRRVFSGLAWSFAAPYELQQYESVQTTVDAHIASGLGGSVTGEVLARLPYDAQKPGGEVRTGITIVVDADVPTAGFLAPLYRW